MAAAAVVALILAALSACVPKDHTAASVVSGKVEFAVCDSYDRNEVIVSIAPLDDSKASFEDVWVARGEGTFDAQSRVVYGQPPAGFLTTMEPQAFNYKANRIAFGLVTVDAFGEVHKSVTGVFDGSSLSTDAWVNQDGIRTSTPCG